MLLITTFVGDRIGVLWAPDNTFHLGVVASVEESTQPVTYDEVYQDKLRTKNEMWRFENTLKRSFIFIGKPLQTSDQDVLNPMLDK